MKLLVLGDSILDHYIFGIVTRQSPEDSSIPIVDFVDSEYRLGGALNVAANLKSLSNKLKDEIYISSIFSTFTAKMLKKKKISYDAIVLESDDIPHKRELVKTRICDAESHRQFLRLDNRLNFDRGDVQRYKNKCFYANCEDFDAIVVSDYDKGLVNDFIIKKLEKIDLPVFVDTKNPDLGRFAKVKNLIFKLNEKEFESVKSKLPTDKPIIVTLGSKGAALYLGEKLIKKFSTEPVQDADVTGAGDSTFAGLIVKYMESKDLEKSIDYANKVANISVRHHGTYAVRREDV